jgi:DNA replication licensing factor MCM5
MDPLNHLRQFEKATNKVVEEIIRPSDEKVEYIQILISSDWDVLNVRQLTSKCMAKLCRIVGMVTSCGMVQTKTNKIACRCGDTFTPGFLPRKCAKCLTKPFPARQQNCTDFQTMKLQELPECVPPGDIPRHVQIQCVGWTCNKVVPGERITIHGIYGVRLSRHKKHESIHPYVHVVGVKTAVGSVSRFNMLSQAEASLIAVPNIYEKIWKSIAPSVSGLDDVKKALVCLLFGGSKKNKSHRADINMLLLGDPGTAKSQLLKFIQKISPIGVYTSGKGSSAVGLTASVLRDPITNNFVVVGGAMVLADGGVVCIDEFDKMKEDDRVAIHEAMEQVSTVHTH